MKQILAIFSILLMLMACSKPLPQDKLHYAGEWQSPEMYLLILDDGTVAYTRKKEGVTTNVNAPLQKFVGDDFVVGIAGINTSFKVSVPPYRKDGKWHMVVDGVSLTRPGDWNEAEKVKSSQQRALKKAT